MDGNGDSRWGRFLNGGGLAEVPKYNIYIGVEDIFGFVMAEQGRSPAPPLPLNFLSHRSL